MTFTETARHSGSRTSSSRGSCGIACTAVRLQRRIEHDARGPSLDVVQDRRGGNPARVRGADHPQCARLPRDCRRGCLRAPALRPRSRVRAQARDVAGLLHASRLDLHRWRAASPRGLPRPRPRRAARAAPVGPDRRRERDPAPRGRPARVPGSTVAEDLGTRGVLRCAAGVQACRDAASAGPRPPVDDAGPVPSRPAVGVGSMGLRPRAALGVALGAAQLVRSVGIWIYAVAALALVVAFVVARRDGDVSRRRRRVALVLGALLPLPVVRLPPGRVRRPAVGGRPEIRQGAPPAARSSARWPPPPPSPGRPAHRSPSSLRRVSRNRSRIPTAACASRLSCQSSSPTRGATTTGSGGGASLTRRSTLRTGGGSCCRCSSDYR